MEFNIPSFANDYNFIICYKENPNQDTWEYYSVADNMNHAQSDCRCLKRRGYKYLVIINISHYEGSIYNDD